MSEKLKPVLPRWTWRMFIIAMVVIIGVLVIVQIDDAEATGDTTQTVSCYETRKREVEGVGIVWQKAAWCGGGEFGRFVDGGDADSDRFPNWWKGYKEVAFSNWHFTKWLKDKFNRWHDVGCSPSGACNTEYETNVVFAEFKFCTPPYGWPCIHESVGHKMQVWADGYVRVWLLD